MMNFDPPEPFIMKRIVTSLHKEGWNKSGMSSPSVSLKPSGVLFILSYVRKKNANQRELCLVLNKRSLNVTQGGDLCCPGGGTDSLKDRLGAALLNLPFSPLYRWPYFHIWRSERRDAFEKMAFFLATGIRESLEEMKLNPFSIEFLGPLPHEPLTLFSKVIHPMVVKIRKEQRFTVNREVERIVNIPVRELLNPKNYARCRLIYEARQNILFEDFPCFVHKGSHSKEVLWGATFRITMNFLKLIYQFTPPSCNSLALIEKKVTQVYMTKQP